MESVPVTDELLRLADYDAYQAFIKAERAARGLDLGTEQTMNAPITPRPGEVSG